MHILSVDVAGLSQLLVQVSNLIVDCPEIQRLDIHPLLASGSEFTALDVTLDIAPFEGDNESRLAVRPITLPLDVAQQMLNTPAVESAIEKFEHDWNAAFGTTHL